MNQLKFDNKDNAIVCVLSLDFYYILIFMRAWA